MCEQENRALACLLKCEAVDGRAPARNGQACLHQACQLAASQRRQIQDETVKMPKFRRSDRAEIAMSQAKVAGLF